MISQGHDILLSTNMFREWPSNDPPPCIASIHCQLADTLRPALRQSYHACLSVESIHRIHPCGIPAREAVGADSCRIYLGPMIQDP